MEAGESPPRDSPGRDGTPPTGEKRKVRRGCRAGRARKGGAASQAATPQSPAATPSATTSHGSLATPSVSPAPGPRLPRPTLAPVSAATSASAGGSSSDPVSPVRRIVRRTGSQTIGASVKSTSSVKSSFAPSAVALLQKHLPLAILPREMRVMAVTPSDGVAQTLTNVGELSDVITAVITQAAADDDTASPTSQGDADSSFRRTGSPGTSPGGSTQLSLTGTMPPLAAPTGRVLDPYAVRLLLNAATEGLAALDAVAKTTDETVSNRRHLERVVSTLVIDANSQPAVRTNAAMLLGRLFRAHLTFTHSAFDAVSAHLSTQHEHIARLGPALLNVIETSEHPPTEKHHHALLATLKRSADRAPLDVSTGSPSRGRSAAVDASQEMAAAGVTTGPAPAKSPARGDAAVPTAPKSRNASPAAAATLGPGPVAGGAASSLSVTDSGSAPGLSRIAPPPYLATLSDSALRRTVYVRNIPAATTDAELRALLKRLGGDVFLLRLVPVPPRGSPEGSKAATATSGAGNSASGHTDASLVSGPGSASPAVASAAMAATAGSPLSPADKSAADSFPLSASGTPRKQYAFAEFATEAAAERFIAAADGKWVANMRLRVGPSRSIITSLRDSDAPAAVQARLAAAAALSQLTQYSSSNPMTSSSMSHGSAQSLHGTLVLAASALGPGTFSPGGASLAGSSGSFRLPPAPTPIPMWSALSVSLDKSRGSPPAYTPPNRPQS